MKRYIKASSVCNYKVVSWNDPYEQDVHYFATYVEVQKEYHYLINMKITFYDLDNAHTPEQIAMADDIITRNSALKDKLNTLIEANSIQGGINQ